MVNPASNAARIAVIDDDPVFLELMQDLLAAGEGYEVVTNSSWTQSIDFVKRVQPDLIMLDLMMGRQQAGWAVLEALRDEPLTSSIPVILCSAAAPDLERFACERPRPTMVIPLAKPFDVDDLLAAIERLLEMRFASSAQ